MIKKRGYNIIIFSLAFALFLTLVSNVSATTNESIQTAKAIETAKSAIDEMISKGIPVNRANDSLQQALIQYSGQLALEEANKKTDFKIALGYAQDVLTIKNNAIKANDELKIFLDTYAIAQQEINLSEMDSTYNDILRSFKEERFEDTLKLIDTGYTRLSEVQSSQTTLKLFYETTSKNIKDFLRKNGFKIAVTSLILVVLIIIFWKGINRYMIKRKIITLENQKLALHNLIKKMQGDYFRLGKLSETEYHVKIERFKEMIRDIDRQIPLLKEDLVKLAKPSEKQKTERTSKPQKTRKKR